VPRGGTSPPWGRGRGLAGFWRGPGWQELSGTRARYRVFNPTQARQRLQSDPAAPELTADGYIALTEACLGHERFGQLPLLSSALAIGERTWIRRLAALIPESRRTVCNLAPQLLPIPADNLATLCVSRDSHRYYIASFIRHFAHGGQRRRGMVRTQVYLTATEKSHLGRLSERTGKSQSEIIRQAIDLFAERYVPHDRRVCLRKARGMWKGRSDLPDLRTLREEFDRSREAGDV